MINKVASVLLSIAIALIYISPPPIKAYAAETVTFHVRNLDYYMHQSAPLVEDHWLYIADNDYRHSFSLIIQMSLCIFQSRG